MRMLFCPITRALCQHIRVVKWEAEVLICGLMNNGAQRAVSLQEYRGECPKKKEEAKSNGR